MTDALLDSLIDELQSPILTELQQLINTLRNNTDVWMQEEHNPESTNHKRSIYIL